MTTVLRRGALLLGMAALFIPGAAAGALRPNIVLIMVDDMGYHELGVTGQLERAAAGQPAIETPSIDRLAAGGLLIRNFYATPICSSTRGALMTGFHNGHSSIDRNGGYNGGNALRDVDVTMPQVLQDAGYATGAYGKWGINGYDHRVAGGPPGDLATAKVTHPWATPVSKGFDEFYGYLNHVHAHDYYVDFLWEHDADGSGDPGGVQIDPISSEDYTHDLISARSLRFVSDHADASGQEPFFLYLPYTIPHGKFHPPEDKVLLGYQSRGYTADQAKYAAMMKRMDKSVGDLVATLKDPNGDGDPADSVYDNTLIVFFSDNGGTAENSLFAGGRGLRGRKGCVHEGGTKTPLIAHWPGGIAPGRTDGRAIAGLEDLFATFAELAGAETPVGLDSASLAGLLTGQQPDAGRAFLIHEARIKNEWSIRKGDWKLSKADKNQVRLFNLKDDPSETKNLLAGAGSAARAVAKQLKEIALAEGVEADAGSRPTQTTHMVQYKSWSPRAGSTDWDEPANWGGGTELNTRGTPANNYDTAPASNWITSIGAAALVNVDADSEVLAFEAAGDDGETLIQVRNGATLTARNGARIRAGATLKLAGGSLATFRAVEVRTGGALVGSGSVVPLHSLPGKVVNNGLVDLQAGAGVSKPAAMKIAGDYQQQGAGRLVVDILPAGAERLHVTGAAALGGALEARLPAAVGLAPGASFEVLSAAAVQGRFDSVKLPKPTGGLVLEVVYEPTRVRIVVRRPVGGGAPIAVSGQAAGALQQP